MNILTVPTIAIYIVSLSSDTCACVRFIQLAVITSNTRNEEIRLLEPTTTGIYVDRGVLKVCFSVTVTVCSGTFHGGQLHRSDPLEGGLPAPLLRHVDLLDELQAAQHVGDVVQPPHLGWNQEVRTEGQRHPTLTLHRSERRGDPPQVLSDVQIPNAN